MEPFTALRGEDEDAADNLYKELLIMQSVVEAGAGNLRRMYPILVGRPCDKTDSRFTILNDASSIVQFLNNLLSL